ncbi:hypothetical protein [Hoylesella buccalis]|uniref:fimbrillin family protein n=1 Tax=Hoylesella buccalis TaxID=28127 RepID=UPI0026EB82EE|nr:hypothetical protein [Hoylesella buccalis]
MKKMTLSTKKYVESCALAVAFMLLPTACTDDIDNTENNGSEATHITFNIQDATRTADEALAKAMTSRATHLEMQGLKPSDITVRTFDGHCSDGSIVTIVEETTPGLPSEIDDVQTTTRGAHVFVTNGALSNQFKATAFFGANSGSLAMDSKFKDQTFNGNGSPIDGSLIWKGSQPCGRFYAYGPNLEGLGRLREEGGKKKIDFEVNDIVGKQLDFVTATSDVVTLSQENKKEKKCPPIKLTFRHPLTALRFKIGKDVLGVNHDDYISSVTIANVKAKGTYILPDESNKFGTWELSNDSTFFELGNSNNKYGFKTENNVCIVGSSEHIANDFNTMFMIPQEGKITIRIDVGGKTITGKVKADWKPGTTKTYSFYRKIGAKDYHLTVNGGKVLTYDTKTLPQTEAVPFTVTSYKTGGTPLGWKVEGYEVSTDGGKQWNPINASEADKMIKLDKASGAGSATTSGEKVTATVHWDVVDEVANRNKTLQNNPVHGSSLKPYNLATNNPGYNVTMGGNTANCYIVSAPGTYAIPLVYGNAIKNGQTNKSAYDTSRKCYKDYQGNEISSPYIIGGEKAKIIWQDGNQVSNNVSIQNNNLVFTVDKSHIKNGNAVVAVTDNKGVVMWSWHLWFTSPEALNTTTLEKGTNIINVVAKEPLGLAYVKWLQSKNSNGTARTEDRHIKIKLKQNDNNGQTATVEIIQKPVYYREINTTSYQFGRKDPMPNIDVAGFNIEPAETDGKRIQDFIQNPGTFYTGAHLYSEFNNGETYSLWASNTTLENHDLTNTNKSIYDPCPAGFKVLPVAYIPIFTNNGSYTKGDWDAGRWIQKNMQNYYLLFAPAGRNNLTGQVEDAGKRGLYWAACVSKKANLSGLVFSPSSPSTKDISNVLGAGFAFNSSCGILPIAE